MARTCYIKTKLRMGEEFISVSDLKNDANYNFISIVNGDQDNLYLKDNYNEISSSPLDDFNFNCDYYDEHGIIAKHYPKGHLHASVSIFKAFHPNIMNF